MENQKNDNRTIEELFESDDELPDSYNEYSDSPQYVDDQRFDTINFDWIYTKKIPGNQSNVQIEDSLNKLKEKPKNAYISEKPNVGMPREGILKKKDLFCLQSVENNLSGNVLLWFANFLVSKERLSKYKYLKGCLVYENVDNAFNQYEQIIDKTVDVDNDKCKYRIVVKNE